MTGPVMKENEFAMAFSRKMREVVAASGIKFDPEKILIDDRTADAVYAAAIELLAGVGLYNADTQRVIQLTKEELEQTVKEVREGPKEQVFGDGQEKVVVRARTAEDKRPPVIVMAPSGVPSTEELYVPYMQSFVQEELYQAPVWSCGVASYHGVQPKADTPSEIYVGLGELELLREVGRRTGKPVTNWMILATTTSVGGVIACIHAGGIKPNNTQIAIHLLPELKLDWSRLRLALYAESAGIRPWTSGFTVMGMLSRGPEDGAVGALASFLGQLMYAHGRFGMIGAMPVTGDIATREPLWGASAAARAIERHLGIAIGGFTQSKAGACTEMAFYEKAAEVVAEVAFGASFIWGAGCRNGVGLNVTAGLEARLIGETAVAVAGLSRQASADLINKIMAKYYADLPNAPQGKTFAEIYNVASVKPTAEYLAVYQRAKDELARLGVPFKK